MAVLAAWALSGCAGGGSDPVDRAEARPAAARAAAGPPRPTVDRFDETAAFALLREQVQRYGHRPAGSPALQRLAGRLRTLMPRGKLEPVTGSGSPPTLQNVVGTVPGRKPAIVVAAHYDVEAEPVGFVGANDGAAGTAAVVTLARAFARQKRPPGARELRFVLFDGEEEPAGCPDAQFVQCALRGSKAYAAQHGGEIGKLVLLDYIAEKDGLRIPREGNSDAAMWAQLRRAAREIGVGRVFPAGDTGGIIDDHYPFLQRRIRAIDLIDFDYPQRDSLQDDLSRVSARSVDAVGETVLRYVSRLRRTG